MATIHRITTDASLVDDLRASLNLRGVPAGVTLGDFISACQSLGIHLNDPIASIEFGIAQQGSGRICADKDDHGEFEIRET